MMYEAGDLLKFSPFEFKNGNQPKPKYFIVLAHIDKKVMMATLPTSKDHVPADVVVKSGCVDRLLQRSVFLVRHSFMVNKWMNTRLSILTKWIAVLTIWGR